jgi:hypothetical protein
MSETIKIPPTLLSLHRHTHTHTHARANNEALATSDFFGTSESRESDKTG